MRRPLFFIFCTQGRRSAPHTSGNVTGVTLRFTFTSNHSNRKPFLGDLTLTYIPVGSRITGTMEIFRGLP